MDMQRSHLNGKHWYARGLVSRVTRCDNSYYFVLESAINEILTSKVIGYLMDGWYLITRLCSSLAVIIVKFPMTIPGNSFKASRASLELTKNIFPTFISDLRHSGWITTHALFEVDEWRGHWGDDDKAE